MKLFTSQIREQLLKNGRRNAERIAIDGHTVDFRPAVKLFTPDAGCTWLLTEIDPEDPDIAFGLCDLGMGFPEFGSVSLSEITSVRGPLGLSIERDMYFEAEKPLSAYAAEASSADKAWGDGVTEKPAWHVVKDFAGKTAVSNLAPHDLRRTCARLCRAAGGELE